MNHRTYKQRARERKFQTAERYAEALSQVHADEIHSRLNGGEIDVAALARETGLKRRRVEELLTHLARSGVPEAHLCGACRLFGAEAECERCSEENHASCLEEVAGRQVCGECASIIERSQL